MTETHTPLDPYAPPRYIVDIGECLFYHTIDLPGLGVQPGEWDLRPGVDDYLGHVDLKGKRVLELGAANGFLTFAMEQRGAQVVASDLCEHDDWDLVPYGGQAGLGDSAQRKQHLRRINNAWWLGHRLFNSQARVVYGPVYNLPGSIGPVDVSLVGSILLHLRDPFLALQRAAALTTDTVIVTESVPVYQRYAWLYWPWLLLGRINQKFATYFLPEINFLPDPTTRLPGETWWNFSPQLISRWLKILGFEQQRLTYHKQIYHYGDHQEKTRVRALYTVVARR